MSTLRQRHNTIQLPAELRSFPGRDARAAQLQHYVTAAAAHNKSSPYGNAQSPRNRSQSSGGGMMVMRAVQLLLHCIPAADGERANKIKRTKTDLHRFSTCSRTVLEPCQNLARCDRTLSGRNIATGRDQHSTCKRHPCNSSTAPGNCGGPKKGADMWLNGSKQLH
jgi:hypothetical protein